MHMCLLLSCPLLSYFALPCLVLSCLLLSCLVLSCYVFSCLVLPCHVMSYLVMSCHVMSCLQLFIRLEYLQHHRQLLILLSSPHSYLLHSWLSTFSLLLLFVISSHLLSIPLLSSLCVPSHSPSSLVPSHLDLQLFISLFPHP